MDEENYRPTKEFEDTLKNALSVVLVAVPIFSVIGGIGIIGYQVFTYLKEGQWHSISLVDTIVYFSSNEDGWATNPVDWVGLHKVLDLAPLSLFLLIFGYLFYVFYHLMNSIS